MAARACRECCVLLIAALTMVELCGHVHAQSSLSPRVSISQLPSFAGTVWPGDFNGDGITDLAGTAAADNRVAIVLGVGDGTFRAPIATSFVGSVLGAADFNNDGRKDLIVDSQPFAPGGIAILPGNGDGTFGASRSVAAYDSATFALTADFDGDGTRDLAIGAEPNILDIYPGRNDLTFGAKASFVTGYFPQGAAVADLNGDGKRDIVVANRYGFSLTILLNSGSLRFTATDLPLAGSPTDVIATDLNGDGRIDLAVSARSPADGVPDFNEGYAYVMTGRGDGTFATPVRYDVPKGAFQIVAGDFTRDGRVDLATANASAIYRDDCGPGWGGSNSVTILPGNGSGGFGPPASFAVPGSENASSPRLNTSDLNGDGSVDLIAGRALLLTRTPGANVPPVVDAGRSGIGVMPFDVVLQPMVSDADGDLLSYQWTLDNGATIGHPTPCISGLSAGTHTFTLTVDDGHGHVVSDTVTYTVYAELPPAPLIGFTGQDIGPVAAAGHSTFDGARFTVTGSGADIWNTADEFQFVSQALTGNFVLTVRVDSLQDVDRWTKAGLMVREDLSAGARHASLFVSGEKGVAFQRRPIANGDSVHTAGPLTAAPAWLKLVRYGDRISAYYRKTTIDFWTLIGRQTLAGLTPSVQAGLAVTSHHDGLLATAVFSSLSAEPLPSWLAAPVGSATGSATSDGARFTVNGSGADIWNDADAFEFVQTDWRGDAVITARVRSLENTDVWAKAGVMLRQSLSADSKQVDLFVSPGKGVAMQYRGSAGGVSASIARVAGTAPAWVRLTRRGSVVEGFVSNDGMTWSPIGSLSIDLGSDIAAGLAVTSHNASTEATAEFDDVSLTP
jgi:regulation of enolase protein 1 (concanavalin A-like superfamily)